MINFEDIAKNMELGGKTIKELLDEQTRKITESGEMTKDEKDFLLGQANGIKEAIAKADMGALLNTLIKNDTNFK